MTPTTPSAGIGADLAFAGVSKMFGAKGARTVALDDVTLAVPAGSIFGVVGYSGAGKSTLIRLVNGLERPDAGEVRIGDTSLTGLPGRPLRELKKRTGMIFQQFNLLDSLTVLDNVARPLLLDGVGRDERRERALESLRFVGLEEKADSYPAQLSGGQKQRVGIARAIIRTPEVLLCDEATSALDPTTTGQIIDLLRRINREYGMTILLVTHEMDVIKALCDRVAVMEDGRVIEEGSVLDVFVHPREATTRDFVRTVMPDGLPEELPALFGGGARWKLLMLGDEVGRPVISELVSDFGVRVNILYSSMSWVQRQIVGQLTIEVAGDPADVARARAHLVDAHGVLVTDLDPDGGPR